MITLNQLDPMVQSAVGRASTPYEQKTFATASPQTLASLSDYYSKLNKDASIVDYLKYTGEDPSLQNREALGQKYGIANVGTPEGNIALLNAMKGGQTAPVVAPVVVGSVAAGANTSGGNLTEGQKTAMTTVNQPETVGGSVSGAAGGNTDTSTQPVDPTKPPVLPEVSDAKTAYTQAQQAVIEVTSKIAEINNAIDSAMQNKRDEIARAGGIVDESQLRSTVLAENAPLLQERNSLTAQRNSLVGEQNIAGKNYNDTVMRQKESDANFYKTITAEQNQQKIDLSGAKLTAQEEQFQQKLEQSGWKMSKVNVLDSAGNVVGQKLTWTQNPASVSSDNAASSTKTSSGSGGISSTGVTNVGNVTATTPPKVTTADGASPEQVLQSLTTGPAVVYKGSTTPVSQQTLYDLAIQDMLGVTSTAGGRTPSAEIPLVKAKESDIMKAYGLTAFDVGIAKNEVKGMTAANTSLLGTAAFTKTYAATANDNLQLALDQSDKVARGDSKLENKYSQWLAGNFTPAGDLAEFETYIYTAAREYAKVTSGGAKSAQGLTDSAQREVDKLINAAQSPEVFKKVVTAMQNDMNNVINNFDKQINSFPDSVKKLYGLAAGPSTGTDLKSQAVSKGFDYDAAIKADYTDDDIKKALNIQ